MLKVALHSDLKIIDPIWTTALIPCPRQHGLRHAFRARRDADAQAAWSTSGEVSPDKLTWTFALRDGLEFHDGQPVTGEDCVASSALGWGAKDSMGQKLMGEATGAFRGLDAKTIKMVLKRTLRAGAST